MQDDKGERAGSRDPASKIFVDRLPSGGAPHDAVAQSNVRVLLVLGRISNLPTVWSNCLAAWLLAGGGSWERLGLVCLGATLLYTGGMFLNDAVDEPFDRRYRSERPIPSGKIASRTVWVWSIVLLVTGWLVFLFMGSRPAVAATVLVMMIVAYDAVHKRTILAPVLMAACRFLVYLLAASVLDHATSPNVLWRAGALAAYIVGLSYLARGESTGGSPISWSAVLLFAPALVAFLLPMSQGFIFWWILAFQLGWTLWCLGVPRFKCLARLPHGVAGLLAGITLVDALAAVGHGAPGAFLFLFFLALLTQRIAPAT